MQKSSRSQKSAKRPWPWTLKGALALVPLLALSWTVYGYFFQQREKVTVEHKKMMAAFELGWMSIPERVFDEFREGNDKLFEKLRIANPRIVPTRLWASFEEKTSMAAINREGRTIVSVLFLFIKNRSNQSIDTVSFIPSDTVSDQGHFGSGETLLICSRLSFLDGRMEGLQIAEVVLTSNQEPRGLRFRPGKLPLVAEMRPVPGLPETFFGTQPSAK